MKVALVHDYLYQMGGAERVVLALHEIFPEAPLFTSIYHQEGMPEEFRKIDIRTSFMQKLPIVFNKPRYYFRIYPKAFESFDFSSFDLIISSNSAFAKGIKKPPHAIHVCYCHTPMRFAWWYRNYIKYERINPILKMLLPYYMGKIKKWDWNTAQKVDYFIANSVNVQKRVMEIYGRESDIIYPPVDTDIYSVAGGKGDYFLIVSRLLPYKRLDIAVDAFTEIGLPLEIVGTGPDEKRLKAKAGKNIKFHGWIEDDTVVAALYKECRALIQTGEEDFGIVPIEAAACGRPTIAFAAGGALESVIDGQTGLLFDRQDAKSLIKALFKFEKMYFDTGQIRRHAESFSKENFKKKVGKYLHENKIL